MTPDPRTEQIRTRRQAGNDDMGIAYSVPADEWHLTCDKPTMQMLKSAPADLAYLLARIEALEADSDRTHRKIRDLTDIAVEATVEYHRLRAVADAARPILDDLRAGEPTPPADVDALESDLAALDGSERP